MKYRCINHRCANYDEQESDERFPRCESCGYHMAPEEPLLSSLTFSSALGGAALGGYLFGWAGLVAGGVLGAFVGFIAGASER